MKYLIFMTMSLLSTSAIAATPTFGDIGNVVNSFASGAVEPILKLAAYATGALYAYGIAQLSLFRPQTGVKIIVSASISTTLLTTLAIATPSEVPLITDLLNAEYRPFFENLTNFVTI